jgi:hypothetical protein
MLGVVKNGLHGRQHLGVGAELVAGIEVAVEAREVAAAHLQRDAVPLAEEVARRPEIDLVLEGLAGCDWSGGVGALTVAGANDAVGEIARVARLGRCRPVSR